jgi:hypothetical protein
MVANGVAAASFPHSGGTFVKKILISVASVGAIAFAASQAQAADTLRTTTEFRADETPVVEDVRMVCDEFGRCWREPRRRTVIIDDSYNAPRERYIERRYYNDRPYHNDRPAAGVGIHAPGVSVGVGFGGDRW